MTRSKLILAGLIAGAMMFGTACKSDKAAEKPPTDPPAEQGETSTPPPTDQGGTTTPPPGGTGGAGDVDADDFGEPLPDTGTRIPEDYGGSGTMNPENPGTGGSGDLPQDDVIQEDATLPDTEGGAGLQDDRAEGDAETQDDFGTGGAGTGGTGTTGTGAGTGTGATDPGARTGTGTPATQDSGHKDHEGPKDHVDPKAKDKGGTGGSGDLGQDERFGGDSFPSDSERVNEGTPIE